MIKPPGDSDSGIKNPIPTIRVTVILVKKKRNGERDFVMNEIYATLQPRGSFDDDEIEVGIRPFVSFMIGTDHDSKL